MPFTHPSRPTTLLLGGVLVGTLLAASPSVITVGAGDTLWELARQHRTTVLTLQELNGLQGRVTIYQGQQLRLPGSARATAPRATVVPARTHVVRAGDTLTHLAQRYRTTVAALRASNGLRPADPIVLGRRLVVPGRTVPARVRPTSSPQASPTTNAGVRIPSSVRASADAHRRTLAQRRQPSRDAVRRLVASTARRHGVAPSLALAVAYHESGFQQRVVSPVDAIGVMQVLPSTGRALARRYRVDLDLLDARDNVLAGVLLLRELQRSVGSTDKVLAGYYQGLGSIQRRGVLPQTKRYIRSVTWLQKNRFS